MEKQKRTCKSCVFWEETDTEEQGGEEGTGTCRRHAPVVMCVVVDGEASEVSMFPGTHGYTWCGEHVAEDLAKKDHD
jgi:hypothetical protein